MLFSILITEHFSHKQCWNPTLTTSLLLYVMIHQTIIISENCLQLFNKYHKATEVLYGTGGQLREDRDVPTTYVQKFTC